MSKQAARPKVSELQLRAYPSSLHSDFFNVHVSINHGIGATLLGIGLGRTGHVISVRIGNRVITEILADKTFEPPELGTICECKVTRGSTRTVVLESGLRYHIACQSEVLALDLFLQACEELAIDSQRAPVMFIIPSANRFSPSSISYATFDLTRDGVMTHVFHSFPDQRAIVKTQSLIELI